MILLDDIAHFLNQFFAADSFGEDLGGVYLPSTRPIRRLGLALEPTPELATWVSREELDALFLHRPWQLQPGQIRADIGVVAYHLAFDERLTLGFNLRLAAALGMSAVEVLGLKAGRAIGMIGDIPTHTFTSYCDYVTEVFGGQETNSSNGVNEVRRLAVVGAMNDALVREAAARGADLYITGQWRKVAQTAVCETGIGVIGVGHRRGEQWGLLALAGVLRERWSGLEVSVNLH